MAKRFGSRAKGKVGEREVARILQPWWAQRDPECEFASTPLSGGWNKASVRGGMKLSGDLCTTADEFPFVVEVKRREVWNLERLMTGKKSPVWGWWTQCLKSAQEQGGVPLLIFRKNREPWYYMIPESWYPHTDPETVVTSPDGYMVRVGLLTDLLKLDPRCL